MTRSEFITLTMAIKGYFPKEKELFADPVQLELWFPMLSDLDYKETLAVIQHYARTNKFSPSIADIREFFDKEKEDSWQELYEHSMRIIARYGIYNEQGGMDALDDISREIVRRIGYKRICNSDEHDPYIRNEFKETFKDVSGSSGHLQLAGVDVKCLTER